MTLQTHDVPAVAIRACSERVQLQIVPMMMLAAGDDVTLSPCLWPSDCVCLEAARQSHSSDVHPVFALARNRKLTAKGSNMFSLEATERQLNDASSHSSDGLE